jgi:hypothetical protein
MRVRYVGTDEKLQNFESMNLKERDHLGGLGVDERMIL